MALALSLAPAFVTGVGAVAGGAVRHDLFSCDVPATLPTGGVDAWIYVSPTGNDANDGSQTSPIASLGHAQDLVRGLAPTTVGNIIVCLEPGQIFRLSQPLTFSIPDSGMNGYDVVWTSGADDPATMAGSTQIGGWSIYNKSKNIWSATVPAGLRTRQIYVNGMRATLTSGAVRGVVVENGRGYQMFPNPIESWPDASGMDFGYLGSLGLWTNVICPIQSVKGVNITMAEPCWKNSTQRTYNYVGWGNLSRPSYMENAFELLGKPGQFYLSQKVHRLYYVPRAGQDMRTADVEVPLLQSLVSGEGSPTEPVHNIDFANLDFDYATWMQPSEPDGFSEIQSNYTLTGTGAGHTEGLCHYARHGTCPYGAWTQTPGNVEFGYDRNISFSNDRFAHLGAAALDLNDGSQQDSVTGSVFTDISGNGIEVGNVDMPLAKTVSQTIGITVSNNYLYGFPVEFQGGCPIIVGYAANTLITHNQVDDVPYSGISIGWGGWPDKYGHPTQVNFSRNNTISDNIVFNFMQLLSDGGGIYTQGITGDSWATGEHVTGNIVHDELDWSRALQSDDGASWDTYADNVLYDNDYDWGTYHYDFIKRNGDYAPTWLKDNYWQQGDPATSKKMNQKLFIESGNTVISGPAQAPTSVIEAAGIEGPLTSLLDWEPAAGAVPNAPQRLKALYAFDHAVYLTWRPGFAYGSSPVTSYAVQVCEVNSASYAGGCGKAVGKPVTISADEFNQQGYVVLSGLKNGQQYSFTATEISAAGASTPSVASDPVKPVSASPKLPGPPKKVTVRAGMGAISVQWYAPGSARAHYYQFASQPILAYDVTVSDASGPIQQFTASSLAQAITSNGGSKTIFMVTGLTPGVRYRVAVTAQTPAGFGKPRPSEWVTPLAVP